MLPRIPVRFNPESQELLKSQEVLSGGMPGKGTDFEATEGVPVVTGPVVRAPEGRTLGIAIFRRNPNGDLDFENAKHVVIDLIHKVADKSPMTPIEEAVLSVVFPTVFSFLDARLLDSTARVTLRIAPWEVAQLRVMVMSHLAAEKNYSGGFGGGSDPMAPITRT